MKGIPNLIHQYKLNGYDIVLDVFSGSVHVVDDVAYDVIAMFPDHDRDTIIRELSEKYAFDPKVQQWMKKVNPWALQNIAETLLEAEQRQMWNADDETKEKLQELYLSVEGEIEEDDEE